MMQKVQICISDVLHVTPLSKNHSVEGHHLTLWHLTSGIPVTQCDGQMPNNGYSWLPIMAFIRQPSGCTTSCQAFTSGANGLKNKSLTLVLLQVAYEQYSHVDTVSDVAGALDVDMAVQTGQV
jgi:hypothetical protein